MPNSTLKILAILSMVIDHVAVIYFQPLLDQEFYEMLYSLFRLFGRIAFPLFCFLIVEGFFHTKDKFLYYKRLLFLAVISEPAFDFAFSNDYFSLENFNVIFTLLLGLLMIHILQYSNSFIEKIYAVLCSIFIAYVFNFDYGIYGIGLILIFYLFHKKKILLFSFSTIYLIYTITAPLALLPIAFYNNKRGLNMKWIFYFFYPVHLVLLKLLFFIYF